MSDLGRKDIHDKVADHATPNSAKSTTDKVTDTVSGVTDKVQRDVLPDSHKSTTQSATDKVSRVKEDHTCSSGIGTCSTGTTTGTGNITATGATDKSVLDKAKHAVGMDKK